MLTTASQSSSGGSISKSGKRPIPHTTEAIESFIAQRTNHTIALATAALQPPAQTAGIASGRTHSGLVMRRRYPVVMVMAMDLGDWRRLGQERYLPVGTVFVQRDYRALEENWEHDHCEMCSAKFMDPHFSNAHAQFIADHTDVLSAGMVTQVNERRLERWVCHPCFDDFATEFGWLITTS